jgi:hypothetical protein
MNPTPRPDPDRHIARLPRAMTREQEYLATTREYLNVVTRGRREMPRALIWLDEALDALDVDQPERAEAKIKRAIRVLNRIDPMSTDW